MPKKVNKSINSLKTLSPSTTLSPAIRGRLCEITALVAKPLFHGACPAPIGREPAGESSRIAYFRSTHPCWDVAWPHLRLPLFFVRVLTYEEMLLASLVKILINWAKADYNALTLSQQCFANASQSLIHAAQC